MAQACHANPWLCRMHCDMCRALVNLLRRDDPYPPAGWMHFRPIPSTESEGRNPSDERAGNQVGN